MGRPIDALLMDSGAAAPSFSASAPSSAIGSSSTSPVTSGTVTCVPTGGTAPYTYLWQWVSNPSAISISASTSATTAFSKTLSPTQSVTGTARCKVTDNLGAITYSNNVDVSLERN